MTQKSPLKTCPHCGRDVSPPRREVLRDACALLLERWDALEAKFEHSHDANYEALRRDRADLLLEHVGGLQVGVPLEAGLCYAESCRKESVRRVQKQAHAREVATHVGRRRSSRVHRHRTQAALAGCGCIESYPQLGEDLAHGPGCAHHQCAAHEKGPAC